MGSEPRLPEGYDWGKLIEIEGQDDSPHPSASSAAGDLTTGLAILRSLIEERTYFGKPGFTARHLQAVYDAATRSPRAGNGP